MDVVKLIRGVKNRQPLWDRKHGFYHDRAVTMRLWDDVASSLGVDPDTVRMKWKGLRDTFRGELKKVHKGRMNGRTISSTNWEYFDEMLFVKDQIYSTRRIVGSLNKPEFNLNSFDSYKVEFDGVVVEKAEHENNEEKQQEIDDARVRTDETSFNARIEDDDYNFLMSILPQLRCLPTRRNLYVRLKIQELLFKEITSAS